MTTRMKINYHCRHYRDSPGPVPVYLVTHIASFSESSRAAGKATCIPNETRLAANESGGSESYHTSDEIHW